MYKMYKIIHKKCSKYIKLHKNKKIIKITIFTYLADTVTSCYTEFTAKS